MYSPRLVNTLNEIANRYRGLILKAIRDILAQPKYKNTGAGLDSLTVEVTRGNESQSPNIEIRFNDRLVFIGLRKLQWTKLPDMKNLLEWAETKRKDPKEAKKLAWSVAWNQKQNDTWKAKPWRKQSLSQVLKEMNELLLSEYDKAIAEDLQQATQL